MATTGYTLKDTSQQALGLLNKHGEMYTYEDTHQIEIEHANQMYAINGLSYGFLEGFTFVAGSNISPNITSEADNGSGKLRIVTPDIHGLISGDLVVLTGMNNTAHNGSTVVTVIDTTTFDCDNINYVANAGTSSGVVDMPSYVKADASAVGTYVLNYTLSGTSEGTNVLYKTRLNVNHMNLEYGVAESSYNTGSINSISGNAVILTIYANDRIWLSLTASSNVHFEIKHCTFSMAKVY